MTSLKIFTLGGLQILLGETPLSDLETRKVEALLVYLVKTGRAQPREALAELLWDERSQQQSQANLRVALTNLRKHLGDFVDFTRDTAAMKSGAEIWLDAKELEDQLDKIRQAGGVNSEKAAELMERASTLYRGEFLQGFFIHESNRFEDWLVRERERYHRLMVEGLHELVNYDLARGAYLTGISHADRLLELDPQLEDACQQMITLLALSGRRSEALTVYERCRKILSDELGVEPSPETRALIERVKKGELSREQPGVHIVRGYELKEQIGKGNSGLVYRAYQPSQGREVAVKVISPQYANQPEFIRSFETEAQIIAQLEHPHIVPLFDYWREPKGAYLVMRWLRGGSLRDGLKKESLNTETVLKVVDHISAALNVVHHKGMIHGDLKPTNILVDETGNYYLSDIGTSRHIDGLPEKNGETVYLSPEQLNHAPLTQLSDIYSLGMVILEMLVGSEHFSQMLLMSRNDYQLPSVREFVPTLPQAVDLVIQSALSIKPAERFSNALELADSLRQAFQENAPAAGIEKSLPELREKSPVNPYKGLQAFQEADEGNFYGREALTQRLVDRLGEHGEGYRFLAVVGPSGSGKSSVVKAGLIPSIRRGVLPGSEKWYVLEMLPGAHPLEELEINLLRIARSDGLNLHEQLVRDKRGLLRAVRLAIPESNGELLLVIDQFEEVFTLVEDNSEARHFLDLLFAAVMEPHSALRVLITLRADFYDRPLLYPDFSELMRLRTEVVTPLGAAELESAIRNPARQLGVEYEEGLVTAIVSDVVEQAGALPLLQYSLMELFEQREGAVISQAAYRSVGGVRAALGRRADAVYDQLSKESQEAAKEVFLRLVTLGEGVEDTRRRVEMAELEMLEFDTQHLEDLSDQRTSAIRPVIEAYGTARLLSFDRDPLTRGPTVEVAHEALLKEWPRLRGWLDEYRADVRMQRALGNAAREWRLAAHDPSFFLRGSRLGQFETWAESRRIALTQEERTYLEASLAEREVQRQAEEKRQAHEKALELRSRRFLRLLVGVLFTATVLASGLAWIARQAQVSAVQAADLAISRELATLALENLDVDPQRSILLALHGLSTKFTKEAEDALHQAVETSRVRLTLQAQDGIVYSAYFSPDDRWLASSTDNFVKVWNTTTGQMLYSVSGSPGRFTPDGMWLVTGNPNGSLTLRDPTNGKILRTFSGYPGPIGSFIFSPDGQYLATNQHIDQVYDAIRLWDLKNGQISFEIKLKTDSFTYYEDAFSPDGKFLYTQDTDNVVRAYAIPSGKEIPVQKDFPTIYFSPDSKWLINTDQTGNIQVWDISKQRDSALPFTALTVSDPAYTFKAHNNHINDIEFSQDGLKMATGSQDGTIKVWLLSPTEAQYQMQLSGHTAEVYGVTFSHDGKRLASTDADGTVMIWDITPAGAAELEPWQAHANEIRHFYLSPDDQYLATTGRDDVVNVWDFASKKELFKVTTPGSAFWDVAISPNKMLMATAGEDDVLRVFDLPASIEKGEAVPKFTYPILKRVEPVGGFFPGLLAVSFSPDGSRLAFGGEDGIARVYDTKSWTEIYHVQAHPENGGITNLAFSPDGRFFVTTSDQSGNTGSIAKVWDAGTGAYILTYYGNQKTGRIWGLTFSSDGKHVVTSGGAGDVRMWDPATGKEQIQFTGHANTIEYLAFSRDGKYLAASDIEVRIWDAATGNEIHLFSSPIQYAEVKFTPDGKSLVVGGRDGYIYGFLLDDQELLKLAHTRVTRVLTQAECALYLHLKQCPSTR